MSRDQVIRFAIMCGRAVGVCIAVLAVWGVMCWAGAMYDRGALIAVVWVSLMVWKSRREEAGE